MPRTYYKLDLAERRTIFRLLNAKMPVTVIAQELGRHRSTIHREIRRNHFHGLREYAGYYPLNAQDLASERRKRQRKLCRDLSLRDYIVAGLERCWSPEQVAGRLKREAAGDATVCHETIYRYVYGPEGREAGLHRHLPKAR
jgi:IS30 family transposase